MDREDLWHQLQNGITLRAAQDQVLWAIFGAFWGSNAILLVALFQSGDVPKPWVSFAIGAVGSLLSWVWFIVQGRALAGIQRHENLMRAVENNLEVPADLRVMREVAPGVRARDLMRVCSIVGAVLWLATTFVSVYFWGYVAGSHPPH